MLISSRLDPHLLSRVHMEFVEMPDLRLTSRQAARLWNLSQPECDELLALLVHEEFLWRTDDGAFLRRGSGSHRLSAPASSSDPRQSASGETERPDGTLHVGDKVWRAHFLDVRAAEGWEWATVALRGTPSYTVLLKMSPRASAGDAAHALDWWLLRPGRSDGDVIEVV